MAQQTDSVSDKHIELFHYTTVDAFRSIFESNRFWATHYEHLNDSSEFRRFGLILAKFIEPTIRRILCERGERDVRLASSIQQAGGIDALVRREAEMHRDVIHNQTFGDQGLRETFIVSFCSHGSGSYASKHGLLSQWRAYGAGGGIAIVLDAKGIEERLKDEADTYAHPINHIGDVTYDDDSKLLSKREFCKVFDRFHEILCSFYNGQQPPYDQIFAEFVAGSTLVKHHAFREEMEIRIVVSTNPQNQKSIFYDPGKSTKPIKYRLKAGREIPYIELFGNVLLPIRCIIVGPSRRQNFNYQIANDLVADRGIEVIKSETPYVE